MPLTNYKPKQVSKEQLLYFGSNSQPKFIPENRVIDSMEVRLPQFGKKQTSDHRRVKKAKFGKKLNQVTKLYSGSVEKVRYMQTIKKGQMMQLSNEPSQEDTFRGHTQLTKLP